MNGIPNKINKNDILSKREREVKQTDTLHVPCHIIIFPERKTTTEKARLGSIFIQKLKPLLLSNYKHLTQSDHLMEFLLLLFFFALT